MDRVFDEFGRPVNLLVGDDAAPLAQILEDFARLRVLQGGSPPAPGGLLDRWHKALLNVAANRMTANGHDSEGLTCGLTGNGQDLLGSDEVQVMLGVSESTARRFSQAHGEKVSGRWLVRRAIVERRASERRSRIQRGGTGRSGRETDGDHAGRAAPDTPAAA